MRKHTIFLTIFVLFILAASVEADAAKLSSFFKIFSKNSTTAKTTTVSSIDPKNVDAKSESTKATAKIEDKSFSEKDYPEKGISQVSKGQLGADLKTKAQAKTTESAKTSEKAKDTLKTSTKWKVADDGKLKIEGKADSVCISLSDQTLTVGESGTVQAKQYEYRSGKVECRGGGFFTDWTTDNAAIEVVECTPTELRAKCRDGFVLSYGGSCSYGDDVEQHYRGIEKLYAVPSFFGNDWDSTPSSTDVVILCNTGVRASPGGGGLGDISLNQISVDKSLHITCIREKALLD